MSETPNHYMGDGTITCADAMASMYEQVNNIKCERDPMTIYWWGCAFKFCADGTVYAYRATD